MGTSPICITTMERAVTGFDILPTDKSGGFWIQTATAPTKGLTLPNPREAGTPWVPSRTALVLFGSFQILRGGLPTTTGNLKLLKGYTVADSGTLWVPAHCGLGQV